MKFLYWGKAKDVFASALKPSCLWKHRLVHGNTPVPLSLERGQDVGGSLAQQEQC